MSNLRRHYSDGSYYFVTCVTYERQPILVEHVDLLLPAFYQFQSNLKFNLHAWVILPDHFHAIVEPSMQNLSKVMQSIKQSFSMNYRLRVGFRGRVWQLRFWDHVMRNEADFRAHIDYVHFNPVKHGLAADLADYSLSSACDYPESVDRIANWSGKEPDNESGLGE